ncbi:MULTISPECIES: cell division protein ZapD [Vitreoscilla]|uniref:Cell division protein ZapD n=1 Tax=Vitreoscilla stercoraria TaxID=61 RepID=A0ABY4EBQ2_VITST|nr:MULTISPECIES: cell division protein ZapD [Vitreoscilla]AUZ05854.1 cell division protein ZapD [Vitreoscilla sp. C1]UOO92773.1 cell division protein ZapD [Vitreoscilla stercoraria]
MTIRFEHPILERVRNLLRVEHLFQRFTAVLSQDDIWSHHQALMTLFEIMECASRAEFKLDILQELERQKLALQTHGVPLKADSEQWPLHQKIVQASTSLQQVQYKFAQHLRENEWLMGIKQRMAIPGNVNPFDLPAYHYWLQLPAESRRERLNGWIASLLPTYNALEVLLDILRDNRVSIECEAIKGQFQQSSLGHKVLLLQIDVDAGQRVIPELSANKYMTNIRFLHPDFAHNRGATVSQNIPFTLHMCGFEKLSVPAWSK